MTNADRRRQLEDEQDRGEARPGRSAPRSASSANAAKWRSWSARRSRRWRAVARGARGHAVGLGAQNMHWEKNGAFTGEISRGDAQEFVLPLRHPRPQRAAQSGETDAIVNARPRPRWPRASCRSSASARRSPSARPARPRRSSSDAGDAAASPGLPPRSCCETVIAYEPVWAIGTGQPPRPQQAQEVHALHPQAARGDCRCRRGRGACASSTAAA